MKKNGFTLAEVLCTLGIIGVVAALTLPKVVSGSIEKTIGPSLGKTVQNIESSLMNLIQIAGNSDTGIGKHTLDVISVEDILPDTTVYKEYKKDDIITLNKKDTKNKKINMFENFQGATGTISVEEANYGYLSNAKMYSGNNLINDTYSFITNGNVYKFPKSKALFVFEPTTVKLLNDYAIAHSNRIDDDVVIARVMIDANATDAPNRLGRDIFLFGIANNGKLVPAGSQAYNTNIFASSEDLYTNEKTGCNGNSVVGNGAACAARVMADDWKINYGTKKK